MTAAGAGRDGSAGSTAAPSSDPAAGSKPRHRQRRSAVDANYSWRTLPGQGWRLRPTRAGSYRCLVTAANRIGRSRDASGAYYFKP